MVQIGNDEFEVQKAASIKILNTKMHIEFFGLFCTEWKLKKKKKKPINCGTLSPKCNIYITSIPLVIAEEGNRKTVKAEV